VVCEVSNVLMCSTRSCRSNQEISCSLDTGADILCCFLIHQRFHPAGQADTFWGPYVRSLPARYSDPLWWSDDDITALIGTNLYKSLPHVRAKLRSTYDRYPLCGTRDHAGECDAAQPIAVSVADT